MNRRDRFAPRPGAARCAACGAPVPRAGVRILARRDDLAFVEVACPACGTSGLVIVAGPAGAFDGSIDWEAPAIAAADVAAVREFLAGYHGDIRGLFAARGQAAEPRPGRGDSHGSAA